MVRPEVEARILVLNLVAHLVASLLSVLLVLLSVLNPLGAIPGHLFTPPLAILGIGTLAGFGSLGGAGRWSGGGPLVEEIGGGAPSAGARGRARTG
jgi:hypothetical protein